MNSLMDFFCPPSSPKGRSGTIVFASITCLFIHVFVCSFIGSFDTLWFPDSHSWTKPHRILLFGTMIDPIKTLLGFIHQLPSPIFDLVITYFLSLELVSGLLFLDQTTLHLVEIGFWTLFPEPNQPGSSCFAQW